MEKKRFEDLIRIEWKSLNDCTELLKKYGWDNKKQNEKKK